MSQHPPLTLEILQRAVAGEVAAVRCVTRYQPAGGQGDKVFPPTYEGGKYATETRRIGDAEVPCVLLDSVQSQANRIELALLDAWEREGLPLPVISVHFQGEDLPKQFRVTSLEAPHRIADALLRDSLLDGVPFRKSPVGKLLDEVESRHAAPLLRHCPTALLFGMWDSTGPRGGLGAKFARVVVSEMVGLHARPGVRTSSRLDPAQIPLGAGPIYQAEGGIGWTLDEGEALKAKGKPALLGSKGKPSEANHGNVTPSITEGSFTISEAVQSTVISLPALRRLRFPGPQGPSPARDEAARTYLLALGLLGAVLARRDGADLRSRCFLLPSEPFTWELLSHPGVAPTTYRVAPEEMIALYREALAAAEAAGLEIELEELKLIPAPQLRELVRRGQELAASTQQEND